MPLLIISSADFMKTSLGIQEFSRRHLVSNEDVEEFAIERGLQLKGVPVSVKAVANVKIKGDDVSLQAAAERFLGMPGNEVQRVIFQTLEGHLRSILGTLTVEEINNDRQSFAQKLTSEAAVDLERMGIGVDVLTIQEISDSEVSLFRSR